MTNEHISRPAFITGLPRSGSTWASQIYAKSLNRNLIHEPFNWRKFPDRKKYHMHYIGADSVESEFDEIVNNTISTQKRIQARFSRKQGIVIKDVHACLAIPRINHLINPHGVILVRHPCAMGLSWSKLGFKVQFRIWNLLSQKDLVDKYLTPFIDHMRASKDYFYSFGAYWGASYFIIDRITKDLQDWHWTTHEDLCIDSVFKYQNQFIIHGFEFTDSLNKRLDKTLLERDSAGKIKSLFNPTTVRETREEPEKWKGNLENNEIDQILKGCEPFGIHQRFYPNE